MNDQDLIRLFQLLQREDSDITNRLIQLENTYQIFHHFDELDLLELLTLKIQKQYASDLEQKLLRLFYYQKENNNEV